MPVDAELVEYLGGGQLIEAPDTERRQVTFKLHQCYPGDWYIITDTSAAPRAPMMGAVASPRTAPQFVTDRGATADILVFGPDIAGPGPMGGQPSVIDWPPGHPLWSPLWDHYVFTWEEGVEPRVLHNLDEVLEAEEAGEIVRHAGTPDPAVDLFVVNCPIPVVGPLTWEHPPD